LQDQLDLKQGRASEVSLRIQYLDEPFKRKVLMSIGVEGSFSDAAEQIAQGGIVRKASSQHELIDEEADERFSFQTVSISDIRADNDILDSCNPAQHYLK
jgi:hypothetical protein